MSKNAWEMTHNEYMYHVFPKLKPENVGPSIILPTRETHELIVRQAVERGEVVPARVRKEYFR